ARGFSLLELLVAMVIMALSLGMLYQASGGSVRAVGQTQRQAEAARLAESLLAAREAVGEAGWQASGQWQGYSWRVRSQPLETGLSGPAIAVLHRVDFEIEWQEAERTRRLNFATVLPQREPPVIAGAAP